MVNLLARAASVAMAAHLGQTRRDGKTPYITHPKAVADLVEGDDAKMVALLHDVVEDTVVTMDDLKEFFPENICQAIDAMSHRENESYLNYVLRLCKNDLARKVKFADIAHNMFTLEDDGKTITRIRRERYEMALWILNNNV